MASGTGQRSIKDYLDLFKIEIGRAAEDRFKVKFSELVGELEILDEEFLAKSMGCGGPLEDVLVHLSLVSSRISYCEEPRGHEAECEALYRDIEDAIGSVVAFRQSCGY